MTMELWPENVTTHCSYAPKTILFLNIFSRKSCLTKKPEINPDLDFDSIERWMVMSAPLLDKIMQQTLAKSFGLTLELGLIPKTEIQVGNGNTKLEAMDVVFLNSALPHEFRNQWRMLFNSR